MSVLHGPVLSSAAQLLPTIMHQHISEPQVHIAQSTFIIVTLIYMHASEVLGPC